MIREQLLNPQPSELATFLTRHTREGQCLVQVAGEAEVTYHGRAASTAEAGHYLLMIKRDGSLQIHHPKGIKPMNWQPRTDSITSAVIDGYRVLTATRNTPAESVTVVMLNVYLVQALELQEESGFLIAGTEAQMQATLSRHPDLIEPGLTVAVREQLPKRVKVRGILAAPGISLSAAMTLERLQLEFKEIHALPTSQEQAAQPNFF